MPTLVLVDGSSYLFRAFYALPDLRTSSGEPTGALRGVVSMLRRLVLDGKPDYFAVVFDAPGKTFRDDLYTDYKSNRKAMPDDLSLQVPALHELVRANGWPLLMIDGVEADDVIGTLAVQARQAGIDIVISTSDKDLAQLVVPGVKLVKTTDLVLAPADIPTLRKLYQRFEFKPWLRDLPGGEEPAPDVAGEIAKKAARDANVRRFATEPSPTDTEPQPPFPTHYEIVNDEATLARWLADVQAAELT